MGQPRAFYALTNARAFLDPDVLARTLADDLAQYIRAAVAARGECHFVFPRRPIPAPRVRADAWL